MLAGQTQARIIAGEYGGSSQRWPLLSLLRILWKYKWHVFLTSAVLSAAVVAVVKVWPATYRAETLILVDQQKIPEKFVSPTVSAELQDRLATISQQILSNTRLQKIIEKSKLYEKERKTKVQEEILEMMRHDIRVTAEKGWIQDRPGAFRVSYEGHNPDTVAEVANQLGNLFIEENLRSRETMAEGTSDFMKTQLELAKKHLEEQEQKLSEFKVTYNGELPQQETSLAQELARLQVQLQGNQDALNRASQNKITIENSITVAQSTETMLKGLTEAASDLSKPVALVQPLLVQKRRSDELEEELAKLAIYDKPGHPDVRTLKLALERVKEQEKKVEEQAAAHNRESAPQKNEQESGNGKVTAIDTQPLDPRARDSQLKERLPGTVEAVRALAAERERIALLSAQLTGINAELKTRQADEQKILSQMESVQARLQHLPMREQEMAEVTRDYQISKANYDSLQGKIFAADMATEMERGQKSERFKVLDPAVTPQKPVRPDRLRYGGLGCSGAVALSMGFWLLAGIRKNKFQGEWELPEGVAVLGRVPRLPAAGKGI
jgi:uncharacterized protein involved in exopolysaccharide biosynthesis